MGVVYGEMGLGKRRSPMARVVMFLEVVLKTVQLTPMLSKIRSSKINPICNGVA